VTRRRRRRIILIIILLVLLAALAALYINFRATRTVGFDFEADDSNVQPMPTYLFSFAGPENDLLVRPIGILVDGDRVLVSDTQRRKIYEFDREGEYTGEFGEGEVFIPLYMAKNPDDGNIWVSDRRLRTIHIYSPEGERIGEFEPDLPEEQLPTFTEVTWAPVAFDFSEDGRLYVAEILKGHRLLVFDEDLEFERSVGTVGLVNEAGEGPMNFQFPNGVKVMGNEVWVSDSNNRRIQVFDLEGDFLRIIPTEGLPRGFDFLRPFDADLEAMEDSEETTQGTVTRAVVVDTLAHDATIWNARGEKVLTFGERGVLEGQFNYPNDLSTAEDNRIYIADTANGRVQVWGWPQEVAPIPIPEVPQQWGWCLTPLLLLPLLLFFRKRRFFATRDFVHAMVVDEKVYAMPHRRRGWTATQEVYEYLKTLDTPQDVDLGELFREDEYSESDVRDLMERMDIERETAEILAIAQRAYVFCTEDMELRRLAKLLEIDVVDHVEFLERFADKKVEEPEATNE
jgi:sugar lactone lactonase YvrE